MKARRRQELAARAAVVKGSEKDLGALAGKRGMTWLEENAKGATWVLTRGENGAACVGPHGQVTFPTKRVRCIDATGAGDAFMAGLVAVLVRSGAKPGSADWKDPKLWSRAMEVGHHARREGDLRGRRRRPALEASSTICAPAWTPPKK